MEARTYLAVDLKSFYASVECVERGLDPMTTHLVVAPSHAVSTIVPSSRSFAPGPLKSRIRAATLPATVMMRLSQPKDIMKSAVSIRRTQCNVRPRKTIESTWWNLSQCV